MNYVYMIDMPGRYYVSYTLRYALLLCNEITFKTTTTTLCLKKKFLITL